MAKIQVSVIEAKDLAAADSNGFSDPFCVLQQGYTKCKTKIKQKTLNPKWNETFSLPATSDTLSVTVWDWDVMSSDDFLGEVKINIKGASEAPTWYKLQPRDAKDTVKGEVCLRIRVLDATTGSKGAVVDIVHSRIRNIVREAEEGPLLDLCGVNINSLPTTSIQEIAAADVYRVDLSFNSFTTMPDLSPIRLQHLNMSGNLLTTLPPSIGSLTSLKELVLTGCQLTELPPELGQLKQLEKLELGNNQLKKICPEMGLLARLEELILTGNEFGTMPPHLGGLYSLEVLDISSCALTALPEEFTLMTRLIELNLGNNKLKKLPEGIGRMTRLANLNVMDNQLTDLPLSIGYCCGLGRLGSGIALARNPIQNEEMLVKYSVGTDHLLDYLEKRIAVAGNVEMPPANLPEDLFPTIKKPSSAVNSPAPGRVGTSVPTTNATPAPAVTAENIDAQLGSKVVLLKNWGLQVVRTETLPKLSKLKASILRSMNTNEVVSLAQQAKAIRIIAEKGKDLVPPRVPPPSTPPPEDKVEALKVAVASTLDDVVHIADGIYTLLSTTGEPAKVITCVGLLKELKPTIDKL